EPPIVINFRSLEATIQVLNEELKAIRAERDELKGKLSERTEAAAYLEISMATLSAKSETAAEEVEQLRRRLEQETDQNRKMLAEVLERMTAQKPAPVRRGWWPFRRSA
ncbi:MAG: hypothetical protein ACJ8CQ_17460, partial [Microvirga sp.]